MRRLPVYLLLDVSGHMAGEPIEAVRNGLQTLVSALRGEPQTLETVYLSVITFGSYAEQLVPLTDITSFEMPLLSAGGATALGEALSLVCNKIDIEVNKGSLEKKGDFIPLVLIMIAGNPTDDWQKGANEIKKRKLSIFACAAGLDVNTNILKQITENVVQLHSLSPGDLAAFFKWVTASMTQCSQKVETGGEEVTGLNELPPPPPELDVIT